MHTYVQKSRHTTTHTYIHVYIYIYTYVHMYIYIYMCVCVHTYLTLRMIHACIYILLKNAGTTGVVDLLSIFVVLQGWRLFWR